jgi:hypothetical protein
LLDGVGELLNLLGALLERRAKPVRRAVVELAGCLLDCRRNRLCLRGRGALAGVELAVNPVGGGIADLLRVGTQFGDASARTLGCRLLHRLPFLLMF